MIVRSLKKLENIIDLYICSLTMGKDGWFFDDSPEAAKYGVLPKDPLYGLEDVEATLSQGQPKL